ncbi:MAG: hypothetical protein ACP5MH_08965 [Thermoproteus sp.]
MKMRRVDPVEEVAELIASLPLVEGLRQIGLGNKSTRCAADSSVPIRTVPRADAGPLRRPAGVVPANAAEEALYVVVREAATSSGYYEIESLRGNASITKTGSPREGLR